MTSPRRPDRKWSLTEPAPGLRQLTCSPRLMPAEETVAVLVVPVSWVSQGGLEHVLSSPPMVAVATVAVLVVPVSCVSQGGLEQTSVTAASSTHLITHRVDRR